MNKQIEALKMVIDFLNREGFIEEHEIQNVIETCKEALAEKLEPMVQIRYWVQDTIESGHFETTEVFEKSYADWMINKQIYGKAEIIFPESSWKSLSDGEMKIIQNNSWIIHDDGSKEFNTFVFARAIEQALKEKNHA